MEIPEKGMREGLRKNQWESLEYVMWTHILQIPLIFLKPLAQDIFGDLHKVYKLIPPL